MIKTLFHGSAKIVEKPELNYSKLNDDFGRGIYLTENENFAKECAVTYKQNGYLNKYYLELDGLNVLDLTVKPYNLLNWIALILNNRLFCLFSGLSKRGKEYLLNNHLPDIRGYDVVIGYSADNSVFAFIQEFLEGKTSYQQLKKSIREADLPKQVVIIDDIALDRLSFACVESVSYQPYYRLKQIRDENLRAVYFKEKTKFNRKNDLYIDNFINEEVSQNDKRLWWKSHYIFKK